MIWIVYIAAALLVNAALGASVWAALDSSDRRLYRWYCEAPSDFLRLLVLELWPFGIWAVLAFRKRR